MYGVSLILGFRLHETHKSIAPKIVKGSLTKIEVYICILNASMFLLRSCFHALYFSLTYSAPIYGYVRDKLKSLHSFAEVQKMPRTWDNTGVSGDVSMAAASGRNKGPPVGTMTG